jgi:hypothetical protein
MLPEPWRREYWFTFAILCLRFVIDQMTPRAPCGNIPEPLGKDTIGYLVKNKPEMKKVACVIKRRTVRKKAYRQVNQVLTFQITVKDK